MRMRAAIRRLFLVDLDVDGQFFRTSGAYEARINMELGVIVARQALYERELVARFFFEGIAA